MTNYTKKILHGTFILFVMSILTAFLSYGLRIILSRSLTKVEFGLFYSVVALTGIFIFLRDMGLRAALAKFIPEFLVKKKKDLVKSSIWIAFLFPFGAALIIALFLIIFAKPLSVYYFKDTLAFGLLILMALAFWLFTLFLIFFGVFQGYHRMGIFSLLEFIYFLVIILVTVPLLKYGLGVYAPALGYIAGAVFCALFFFIVYRFTVHKELVDAKTRITKSLIKKLFSFSIYVMFATTALNILGLTDTLLLTYFSGLGAVAEYNVALPISKLVALFGTAISMVLLPLASRLWANKELKKLTEGTSRMLNLLVVSVLPLAAIMLAYPDIIIRIFFGNQYVVAQNVLRILIFGFFFFSIFLINISVLNGIGKPKLVNKIVITAVVINLILNVFLIIPFQGIGAAIATSSSYFLIFLLSSIVLHHKIRIRVPWANWLKSFVFAAVFLGIITVLKAILNLNPWVELIITIGVAGLAYAALIVAFKVVSLEEISGIIKQAR